MKRSLCLNGSLGLAVLLMSGCVHKSKPQVEAAATPTPVYQELPKPTPAPPQPVRLPAPPNTYEQKLMGGPAALISPEQAQAIIARFKDAYPKLGSPRLLIYVNRELVDEHAGMKLVRRTEHVDSSRTSDGTNGAATSIKSSADNTYRPDDKPQPTLADKQTVRDIERLFARPLRAAGATLVDQKVATELIADRPLDEFIGTTDTPQARKDREALGKVADAVIEILISSKSITVPTITDSQTLSIPDIQATVISLKDSKIMGLASSTDVTSRVPQASLGNFDPQSITEATALALMDDMAPGTK